MAGLDENTVLLVRGTADGIVDLTGKSIINTGTTVGDETSGPFAWNSVSRALVLDGNSYIAYPSLGLTGSFTIDGWFQTTSPATEQRNTYNDNTDNVFVIVKCLASKFNLYAYPTLSISSSDTVQPNTYYHVASIFDYNKQLDSSVARAYLFVNGSLKATGDLPSRGYTTSPARYIGASRDATLRWSGKIAEFRVSNIARDPAEFPPIAPYSLPVRYFFLGCKESFTTAEKMKLVNSSLSLSQYINTFSDTLNVLYSDIFNIIDSLTTGKKSYRTLTGPQLCLSDKKNIISDSLGTLYKKQLEIKDLLSDFYRKKLLVFDTISGAVSYNAIKSTIESLITFLLVDKVSDVLIKNIGTLEDVVDLGNYAQSILTNRDTVNGDVTSFTLNDNIAILKYTISKLLDTLSKGTFSSTSISISDNIGIASAIQNLSDKLLTRYMSNKSLSDTVSNIVYREFSALRDGISEKDIYSLISQIMDAVGSEPPPFGNEDISIIPGQPGIQFPEQRYAIYIDGMPVRHRIESISMSFDEDSVHNSCNITSIDVELREMCDPEINRGSARVEVQVGTESFTFMIDTRELSDEQSFTLNCLSLSAKNEIEYLPSDWYAPEMTLTRDAMTTAQNLVAFGSVEWNVGNFILPEDFEYADTPIACLQNIAATKLYVVRSLRDDKIEVRRHWPVRPIKMSKTTPDFFLDRSNVSQISGPNVELGTGYNRIKVSRSASEAPNVDIEVEEGNLFKGENAFIRVFWPQNTPPVELDTYMTAGKFRYIGENIQTMPYKSEAERNDIREKEKNGEEVDLFWDYDDIEFSEGKASVSHPIHEIKKIAWIGKIPGNGEVEYTKFSKELFLKDGLYGLAKIKYTTKYHRYLIYDHNIEKLMAVLQYYIADNIAAIVQILPGDKQAADVADLALTTVQDCVDRGQAELDIYSYDKQSVDITTPYRAGMMDGKLVYIRNENVNVNGVFKIKSMTVNFDGPAIWAGMECVKCLTPLSKS